MDGNPRGIGDNLAPADADPLRERLTETHGSLLIRRDDLLSAADRVPAEVADEDMARKVADFIKQIMAHHKLTETTRVGEKEPYLQGSRTVDGWFKGITDPLEKAKKAVEAKLTVYQRKKADDERRAREEEERMRRAEADRLAKEAAERAAAFDAANDTAGAEQALGVAIEAEDRALTAAADAAEAEKAAQAKAADLSRTRGDYGAVASLRTFWDFCDLDRAALDLETLRPHLPQDALEKAVRAYVKAGGRELRGVRIFENSQAVVR